MPKEDYEKQSGNFLTGIGDQIGRILRMTMGTVDWVTEKPLQRVPASVGVVGLGLTGAFYFFQWKGQSAAPLLSIEGAAPEIQNPVLHEIEKAAKVDDVSILLEGFTIAGEKQRWEDLESCTDKACPIFDSNGNQIGLVKSEKPIPEWVGEKYSLAIQILNSEN